ncbi:MAG: xanthine dehydrogenase family protein molybdopterin-binding subunit [Chloroflexi bacterium]|nr:xanthine dehydrogenase family protein molybdopterin-binding subunit [Chloroflexota bacterium]
MESIIGIPTPRVEGWGRVTGSAKFTADVSLEGALWAKVVRSPIPHGRIMSIDTSAALAVPGVHAVVTAKDLPDPKRRMGRSRLKDVPILCDEVVRFIGDRVAVVAADTKEAAEEAALLVQVDYEELPAVFDPLEAMEPGAPLVHPDIQSYVGFDSKVQAVRPNVGGSLTVAQGDVEAGFREADLVVEGRYSTQQVHHGYLEPNAFAVQIDDGRIHVWASNKVPFNLKNEIAAAIGVDPDLVVCEAVSEGGDFGGKAGQADPAVLYTVAKLTGRPVKQVLTYPEDLAATSPRHPAQVWLKTGVKRDGTITAQEGWIVYNSGAYAGFKVSPRAMPGEGAELLKGCYEIPNVRLESYAIYTNQVPGGYMRAPGQPQAYFAVESHMNLIARKLGMDPYELRARNVIRHETLRPDVVAPTVLEYARQAIGWESPKPPNVGRGIAIGGRYTSGGEGSSDITINPDGTVTVISAITDNGPGGLTTVAQTAANFFGIPIDRIRLIHGNTDSLPVDAASAGSRVTNVVTRCVTAAGEQVIEQLAPLAAFLLGTETATWEKPGWRSPDGRFVSLGELAAEALKPGDERAHARVTLNFPNEGGLGYCAQAAEVEVDPETGEIKLRRMVSVQDVGTVLNPLSHRSQVQGSVVQGIGFALTEDLAVEDGRLGAAHLGEYKLPVMADVPELTVVDVPSSGVGPLNVRSIGEIVIIPTAAAIAGAVMDATGIEIHRLPITAEQVLEGIDEGKPGRRELLI